MGGKVIISLISTLSGVFVGGIITIVINIINEKRKDKRYLVIVYNEVLSKEINGPLEDYSNRTEDPVPFRWDKYSEGARENLFNNIHLMDRKVVRKFLRIGVEQATLPPGVR